MPLVIGLVALVGAVLLLTSGVTDASFADVITGKAGKLYRENSTPATGAGTGASSSTGTRSSSAGIPAAPTGGNTVIGDVTDAMLQTIGAAHGWSGQEIADWENVIKAESNGTITDTNPGSQAYGIGQFLASPKAGQTQLQANMAKYQAYGGNATSVMGQLTAMANYIAAEYGNPTLAWAHEQNWHWY